MPLSFAVGPKRRYATRTAQPTPAPPTPTFTPPRPIGSPTPRRTPQVLRTPEPTPERRQLSASVYLGQPTTPAVTAPAAPWPQAVTAGQGSVMRTQQAASLRVPQIRLPSLQIPSTYDVLRRAQEAIESFVRRVQETIRQPTPTPPTAPRQPSIGELRRIEGGVVIPSNLRPLFQSAAQRTGVPLGLLAAVARIESGFRVNARGSSGEIGLMQLMPGTARGLGVNPYDPAQNVLGGATYLAQQLRRFGDLRLALAAYNAGPGRVAQAIQRAGSRAWSAVQRYLPEGTRRYVSLVLRYYGG